MFILQFRTETKANDWTTFSEFFSRKNVSVRCEKLAFRASSECTQLFICFVRFVSSDVIHFCCWKQKELFLVIEYCFVYFLNDALLFHILLFNTLNATKDFYLPTEIFCWSINDFFGFVSFSYRKCRWKRKSVHYHWFDRVSISSYIRAHLAQFGVHLAADHLQQLVMKHSLHINSIYPAELWINRCDHIVSLQHLFQFFHHEAFR